MSDTTRAAGQTAEERASEITPGDRANGVLMTFGKSDAFYQWWQRQSGVTTAEMWKVIAHEIQAAEERGRQSIFQEEQVHLLELAEGLFNEARLGAQGIFMANLTKAVMQAEQRGRAEALSEAEEQMGHTVLEVIGEEYWRACQQQAPCPWADLAGLSGRALREALRGRAREWRSAALTFEQSMLEDRPDLQMLIDHIYALELPLTQEAERLWAEEQARQGVGSDEQR